MVSDCRVAAEQSDVASGGLPCQAVSKLRWKSGPGTRQGLSESHPGTVTVKTWKLFLKVRRPKSWFVEDVLELDEEETVWDEGTRMTYMQELAICATALGYSARVVAWDQSAWVMMPRKRLFCLGCDQENGGTAAITWIADNVTQLLTLRERLCEPEPVWRKLEFQKDVGQHKVQGLVDPTSSEEAQWQVEIKESRQKTQW